MFNIWVRRLTRLLFAGIIVSVGSGIGSAAASAGMDGTVASAVASACAPGQAALAKPRWSIDGTTVVNSLAGKVHSGDRVEVQFTVPPECAGVTLSLVSYNAPAAAFDAVTAGKQRVSDSATGSFGAGPHALAVTVPACYFQVDFVVGPVIPRLGPANTSNFYSAQGRLLDHDNGGTRACATPVADQNGPTALALLVTDLDAGLTLASA